jgi:hypothetical protein
LAYPARRGVSSRPKGFGPARRPVPTV